jgi:hypothetical protein
MYSKVVFASYSSRKRAGEVAWPNGACEVFSVALTTTSALPFVYSANDSCMQSEEALSLGWAEVEQRHVFLSWRVSYMRCHAGKAFR